MNNIRFLLTEGMALNTNGDYQTFFFYGDWSTGVDQWHELCGDLHKYYDLPEDHNLAREWCELRNYWLKERDVSKSYFTNAQVCVLRERGEY